MADKLKGIIDEVSKLTVTELAELVKAMEEQFGISAAAPAAATASGGDDSDDEKANWDIILKAGGEQKIQVIKIVKEVMGVGLKDAKDLVDGAPKPLKEGVPKAEAEELKKKLEEVGASVELK